MSTGRFLFLFKNLSGDKQKLDVVYQDDSNVSLRYGVMREVHYQCAPLHQP